MGNLRDDFNQTLNGEVWVTSNDGDGIVNAIGGRLLVTFGTMGANAGVATTQQWDLNSDAISVEITAGGQARVYFGVFDQFPDSSIYAGFTRLQTGELRFEVADIAGGIPEFSDLGTIDFNVIAHRFWRVRHDGTNIVYEVSAMGVDWEQVATFQPVGSVRRMVVAMGAVGTAGDTAIAFDNVNGGGTSQPQMCPD